jgi:hypothetical protein
MSVPKLQRIRKQPPTVFPTEKEFEKFKPLLETYLHQWFEFVASVKSGTDAGQTILTGGTGGTVYAAGRSTFVSSSSSLFIAVPGIAANAVVVATLVDPSAGSAPKIWCQSGFTLYQDTPSGLDVFWIVVNP